MDGWKRELDPANELFDLIYVFEKWSSMEFQVYDETRRDGNIRRSRIGVADAFPWIIVISSL